jgi:membrane protein
MSEASASPTSDDKRPTWGWATPTAFWQLLYTTAMQWSDDNVPRLGAALAFYSVLSIAPLLLICLAGAALIFGKEAATGQIVGEIRGLVGKEGAEAIQEMLTNAHKPGAGTAAAVAGFATLLFAASGVFGELQGAMNTIWKVQYKPGRGMVGLLRDRFFSFAMVLGTGFLLLTSLVLSAVVAATSNFVVGVAPALKPVLQVGDTLVSATIITLLFALIFKLLPDAKIAWRDVWVGAAMTMVVFLVGKAMIGAYLGRSSFGSAYGAAGSLVVLVVWVYYSSQIVYFGAEFTQVYANRYGTPIEPTANAKLIGEGATHEKV